jgi:trimeric autotransporter adhesin
MKKILSWLLMPLFILLTVGAHAQYMSTFAGQGYVTGHTGDGGPATAALMYSPSDIAFDVSGNLYIADFVNNVIRKVDTFGIISTVAGTFLGAGTVAGGNFTGDGGPATAADLNGPFALAIDASGSIIFADGYNHRVRKVTTAGIITTIAGSNSPGYVGDGGPATLAQLNNPVGIAIDRTGNIYIADDHNNVIRKINTSGVISTFAGNTTAGHTGDGGPATAAELNLPIGIAFDTAQNLYIADSRNNVIRMVNTAGIISTVVGNDTAGYTGDGGPASAAKIDTAQRINFDDANNMYISDFYNNVVRRVDAVTHIITTVAGNGVGAGLTPPSGTFSGDDSLATNAGLFFPCGVAFDARHRMYISDRGNDAIRRVGPEHSVDHSGVKSTTNNAPVFSVYPNPASNGVIAINLVSNYTERVEITLTNVLGETVYTMNTMTNSKTRLKLNNPPGVYVLTANTASGRWMKRIIVQ